MIERIIRNEERLDKIKDNVDCLQKELEIFKSNKRDLYLLNNYYGSKNWIKDKESFENGKVANIKAGVLSEDAVWNMLEDINDLLNEMKIILKDYNKL